MRHWLWRAMGVLALGGGFTGVVFGVNAALVGGPLSVWISVGLGLVIYGTGTWVGFRLLEGKPGAERLNLIYWWLQVPVIQTPVFGLRFYCGAGAQVSATFGTGQLVSDDINLSANAFLGSQFEWSLGQLDRPWTIGINLFALAVALWAGRLLRQGQMGSVPKDIW